MPAALWGHEYEGEFVKGHLGPALERASLDTKVWILDHNYNLWGTRDRRVEGDPSLCSNTWTVSPGMATSAALKR